MPRRRNSICGKRIDVQNLALDTGDAFRSPERVEIDSGCRKKMKEEGDTCFADYFNLF